MKTIFIFLATAAAPYADAKVCRFPPPIDDQVVMLESLTMNYDGMTPPHHTRLYPAVNGSSTTARVTVHTLTHKGSIAQQQAPLRISVTSAHPLAAAITTATTLMPGDTVTLKAYRASSEQDNADGSGMSELQGSDDADYSYAYTSEYGYSDDANDAQVSSTGQATVLYFSAQTADVQLSVELEGSSSSEVVSIAIDPIPSHGYVYGDGSKLRVIGFSDNLGRECRDGVIVGAEDNCVSVPSETCTDAECCRGMVCTVMPSGPNRCRLADVPGLSLLPTRPAVGIPEPTNEPDASTQEEPINIAIIIGITLAIAALVVLVGIIVVRSYKKDKNRDGSTNRQVVLTLESQDCATDYASESGWESSHFTSRQQSRLQTGRSSTGYSTYSNNMPTNPPPPRRTSKPDDLGRESKFQWKHSSHGDVV